MKKFVIALSLFTMIIMWQIPIAAENTSRPQDSKLLQLNDMLMIWLGKPIGDAVNNYYSKLLTENPSVYPYQVEILDIKRVPEFRSFHFYITLELTPVVGPHIPVGMDRLIFEIAPTVPDNVKLVKYEHLQTYELPPHWQHIMKKSQS